MEFGDEEPNIDFRHVDAPRFREGGFKGAPRFEKQHGVDFFS